MHVVVLSPSGVYDAGSLPQLQEGDYVSVIVWRGVEPDGATTVPLTRRHKLGDKITAAVSGAVAGRVLLRLTPLDSGARFWRATASDATARALIRGADLIVAPERDGAYAAWRWARASRRAGTPLPAVFGYPAARAAIERLAE